MTDKAIDGLGECRRNAIVDVFSERWSEIEGYNGDYLVSSNGAVKSKKYGKERTLRQSPNTKGYPTVFLSNNCKKHTIAVHRLVGIAFVENKNNKPQINHIDEDKTNNNVANLEWVTNLENMTHGTRMQRIADKMRNGATSKAVLQKTMDGNPLRTWQSMNEARRNGYTLSGISKCCNGKRKSHKGFLWQFL